jgi:hypothetical protein
VESTPHWSRTWEAGNQVMLWADCRFSRSQTAGIGSPSTLRGSSHSTLQPQLHSTPVQTRDTTKLRRFSRNVQQTLGGMSTRSSGLATPTATTVGLQKRTFTPTVFLSSSKQVGAQQPRTECRTQGTPRTVFRLVGGGESSGFPIPTFWEFQPEMSCTPCFINTVYLLLP